MIVGDVVYLYEVDMRGVANDVRFEGVVHEVQLEKVLLGMHER